MIDGRARAFLMLVLPLLACSTETPGSSPCYPGDYIYCACDSSVQGYSQCPTDGGDYGSCNCSGITPAVARDASGPDCNTDGGLPYECPCASPADCASGVCHNFPAKGGNRCTASCTVENASTHCPAISGGCNMMGVCMVP